MCVWRHTATLWYLRRIWAGKEKKQNQQVLPIRSDTRGSWWQRVLCTKFPSRSVRSRVGLLSQSGSLPPAIYHPNLRLCSNVAVGVAEGDKAWGCKSYLSPLSCDQQMHAELGYRLKLVAGDGTDGVVWIKWLKRWHQRNMPLPTSKTIRCHINSKGDPLGWCLQRLTGEGRRGVWGEWGAHISSKAESPVGSPNRGLLFLIFSSLKQYSSPLIFLHLDRIIFFLPFLSWFTGVIQTKTPVMHISNKWRRMFTTHSME